jgi:hypothetical protein
VKEVEFLVPRKCNFSHAEKVIEAICERHGLRINKKGALASFPGSIHWHFKNGRESGTLELTLWPRERRIWAQVQDGRRALWIEKELPGLQKQIEAELKKIRARTKTT